MPTIKDVAKRAGVAPITASRVINESGYVSEATRQRVEAAIEELGYVPNRIARSLRSKQTYTLALVLTDIANPFWPVVARGVEDAANKEGFSVILGNSDESEAKEYDYVRILLQKQVDGFILAPARSDTRSVALIRKQKVPLVILDRTVAAPVDTVRSDSVGGAYELTRHLLELGHRRIAMLSGPQAVSTSVDRVTGFRRAFDEAGVPVDERMVIYGSFAQAGGYEMTQQVLAMTPRPTAYFAANSFIALGAFRALRDGGLRVPEDVALVAFDDLTTTFTMDASLTVVAQRAYEMGQIATQLLLKRLREGETGDPEEIILPTEILVRQSSNHRITG